MKDCELGEGGFLFAFYEISSCKPQCGRAERLESTRNGPGERPTADLGLGIGMTALHSVTVKPPLDKAQN